MNALRINNFLSQISQDPNKKTRFLNGERALLEEFRLTAEEQEAVLECQANKLYEAGVHPLLMMQLSIFLEKDIKALYQQGK